MFDATKLLGGFLEGRKPGAGAQGGGLQQMLGQFGGGGGLGGLLSQFTGGGAQTGGAPGAGSGLMGQIADMARRAVAAPGAELRQNNPAAIGGAGALAGALMGGGRGAVGGGLLAVLGSLAYSAWQNQNAAPGTTTVPAPGQMPAQMASPQLAPPQLAPPQLAPGVAAYADPAEMQRKAGLVLRAMIQATKADGHLDDGERQRLTSHMTQSGAKTADDAEAEAFLQAELGRPVDVSALAAECRSPEEAAEIYAASVMAISVDTAAERAYLAELAAALRLPANVVTQIDGALKPG